MTTRTYTAFLFLFINIFPLKNNTKKKQLKVIYYDSAAHDPDQTCTEIWVQKNNTCPKGNAVTPTRTSVSTGGKSIPGFAENAGKPVEARQEIVFGDEACLNDGSGVIRIQLTDYDHELITTEADSTD